MKTSSTVCRSTSRFLRRLFGVSLAVWLLGFPFVQAQAAVTVDQQPLTTQKPLPPNIVLMLDDSGSMQWDYMPDLCYLNGVTCGNSFSVDNKAMIDAANNGVYYNPTITYSPPPMADGTSYPNQTDFTKAPEDGFSPSQGTVDLTKYHGNHDTTEVDYSSEKTLYQQTTYNNVTSQSACYAYYTSQSGAYDWYYDSYYQSCTIYYKQFSNPFFQYSTGPAAGPYTLHYVAADSTGCGSQSNCVTASDTSGVAAPAGVPAGQNIANWFAYYHTRILMAKSGLMNSFSTINPTFRIGFGSINGNNNSSLPSPTSSYNGRTIADVEPFGDGSSGTQRAAFWNWLVGINPYNGTPLRTSLDAVGQYYQSSQPWETSSSDTSELACRQSYTILTTDGFWNGNNPGVGDVDSANGPTITGPDSQSYTYVAAAPYSDGRSDTLADVAMKYWMNDLQTGIKNEVPTSTEDPAFWQHMVTFTLGLGFTPVNISPSGTTVDQIFKWADGGAAISNFSWPAPASNSINNIADLAHAGVDGHGGFYSATDPQSFTTGMADALKRAAERVGTGASLAANSTELKTGTMAYQANYYTSKWKGDLKAYPVDPNTGTIATNPTWTAVSSLPAWSSRNIYTYNPDTLQFVAFTSPAALSAAEQSALGSSTTEQQNVIDYLRGDAAMEQGQTGGTYRKRDTPLGDIVDSQPVYVGAPDPNQFVGETFTGSTAYSTFATNEFNRGGLIYVAANDGMLHAFDASTGAETFAFMPAAVITHGIKGLTDPDYGSISDPHQYFNDGELTVADVYMSGVWKTVLVGTTGRGAAKDVYALDITDPSNIKFLWERWAGDGKTDSNYIGQMVGKPVIAQTADGTWSVLMGNGYNSSAGVAALLQFNLADGSLNVHTTTDTTGDNGLAAPVVWMDDPTNGVSTVAYAGDLHGHVWSFPLYQNNKATPSSTGSLLFTATDAAGNVQPITAGMLAGKDPQTGNVWLFFGTGRYLSSNDLTDKSVQTWYGIIAQSSDPTLVKNLGTQGRASLVQRYIVAQTTGNLSASPPVLPARAVTPMPSPSDMSGKSGWYMNLLAPNGSGGYVQQGERMVTPNQFQGNLLLGTTRIPDSSDLCNPSGTGWIMAVDPFTGTNPAADFFDTNGDGVINSADEVTVGGHTYAAAGVGFTSLPNNPIFVGGSMLVSFDNGTKSSLHTSGSTGGLQRVSWRELVNH